MKATSAALASFLAGACLGSCGEVPETGKEGAARIPAVTAAPAVHEWPLFRSDANMRGVSGEKLTLPLVAAWEVATGGPVPATAVLAEGRVYAGSLKGEFFAWDLATGKEVWKAPAKLGVEGPACLVDGLVCFGDADGKVHALDRATGQERWVYETGDSVAGGLNACRTRSGKVLILAGSDDFFLHAIHAADGTRAWAVETGNYIKGTPSVDQEGGLVIFGGCDELVRLIDAESGALVRQIGVGAYMGNSCAVRDQVAYVAHYGGAILALDLRAGTTLWTHEAPDAQFVASPAVTADRVYVTGRDSKLRCLDRATGKLLWEFSTRKGSDSSPVVTESAVFFGADDGRLYAVHPTDGRELWSFDLGSRINSSPALGGGHLVIGSQEGILFAFRSGGD